MTATSYRGPASRQLGCALGLLIACMSGCVRHIQSYTPRERGYEPVEYAPEDEARTRGSLWSAGANRLFEDARARRVGDIITIRIDEQADATRQSSTETKRESKFDAGISSFFSAMQQLSDAVPEIEPSDLLAATSSFGFDGGGSTQRSGALSATLPVHIKRVLPNGDFYVEGHKVLLINDEESHLYVSGVVRPVDIQPDNSVSSSFLADVEMEYTGRGVITDRQRTGWLARLLDYIYPF